MKARLYIICVAVVACMAAWGQQKLVVLHTNDTHSTIMPLSRNLGDTMLAGRGGYLRRMELLGPPSPGCCSLTAATSRRGRHITRSLRAM